MDGRTSPLHEAAKHNRAGVVRLLLDHGANPLLTNGDGKTPLDMATELGHVAIVELLQSVGES
jgi:ankyrin repeat protein